MPKKLDAVVCYENAARDTFEAARKQNVTTILDAASFHHEWQDAFHEPMESDKAHAAINRRKDEEVELADHILTVSEFARQSYIDAGVAPEHVTSVPVGADLSVFKPDINKEKEGMKPFTFLFAGHAGRRKGVDVLLEASEYLSRDEYNHQIQFAGGADDGLFDDTDAPVERLGYLSAPDLAAAFRQSDVLVLPSRHDSFGRVVVEAMATGLTAIVSEHVGAKEAITQGKTGWIVPAEDAEALAEQMRWCVEHQEQVRGMRPAAIASAQGYSWSAYRERVSDIIVSVARQ
jgi:glycosyltransferase involved in cell wall biosynthesis